jgi:hypothetical protein
MRAAAFNMCLHVIGGCCPYYGHTLTYCFSSGAWVTRNWPSVWGKRVGATLAVFGEAPLNTFHVVSGGHDQTRSYASNRDIVAMNASVGTPIRWDELYAPGATKPYHPDENRLVMFSDRKWLVLDGQPDTGHGVRLLCTDNAGQTFTRIDSNGDDPSTPSPGHTFTMSTVNLQTGHLVYLAARRTNVERHQSHIVSVSIPITQVAIQQQLLDQLQPSPSPSTTTTAMPSVTAAGTPAGTASVTPSVTAAGTPAGTASVTPSEVCFSSSPAVHASVSPTVETAIVDASKHPAERSVPLLVCLDSN